MTPSWTLDFDESPPGLNSSGRGARRTAGMLRGHWRQRKPLQERWNALVLHAALCKNVPRPMGRVRLTWTRRYCGVPMDWDNACSSFKVVGDALVRAGVLQHDGPDVIVEFVPKQRRVAKRAETGCSVTLEPVG